MANNNSSYDPHVNIKMELDEDPSNSLSFLMSNVVDEFGGGVSGLLEDVVDRFHSASDDGVVHGSSQSQSLTLYKSEPVEQEEAVGSQPQDPVFGAFMVPQRAEDLESGGEPGSSSDGEDGDDDGSSSDGNDSGSSQDDSETNEQSQEQGQTSEQEIEQLQNDAASQKTVEYFASETIDDYLNCRGYRNEMAVPNEVSLGIFTTTILPGSARAQSVRYGPNYESQEIPREMDRFWAFYLKLKEQSLSQAYELQPVLIPMLLHFYQETYRAGFFDLATKIYNDFSLRFRNEGVDKDAHHALRVISRLIASSSSHLSPEGRMYIQNFAHREYSFVFSEPLFEKLKAYLCSSNSLHMLNLFAYRFKIALQTSKISFDTFVELPQPHLETKPEFLSDEDSSSSEPLHYRNDEDENLEAEVTPARESIHFLRNSVDALLPNISVHAMSERPISGAVSSKGSMLAFGMLCSEIRLCVLSKETIHGLNWSREIERSRRRAKKVERRKRKAGALDLRDLEGSGSDDSSSENEEEVETINFLHGHAGPVQGLMFHPQTKLLFSVSQDTTMRAWNLDTFKCQAIYRGHSHPIWCMDISSSGHMIVTGSMDTSARVWLPESTRFVRLLVGHYADVDCVKFHPNEAYVGTGSVDKSVRLWSVAEGHLLRVFTGSTDRISSLAFHESGKYIIGGGDDSIIRIWDIAESETVAELPSAVSVGCRDISICKNMLAAAFADSTIRLWNLRQLFGGDRKLVIEDIVQTDRSDDYDGSDNEDYCSLGSNEASEENDKDSEKRSSDSDSDAGDGEPESLNESEQELSDDESPITGSDPEKLPGSQVDNVDANSDTSKVLVSQVGQAVEVSSETTEIQPKSPGNKLIGAAVDSGKKLAKNECPQPQPSSNLLGRSQLSSNGFEYSRGSRLGVFDAVGLDEASDSFDKEFRACFVSGSASGSRPLDSFEQCGRIDETMTGSPLIPNLEVSYGNVDMDLASYLGADKVTTQTHHAVPRSTTLDFVMGQEQPAIDADFDFDVDGSVDLLGLGDPMSQMSMPVMRGVVGSQAAKANLIDCDEKESSDDDSQSEVELEPVLRRTRVQLLRELEMGKSARIPSPKIIPCESSSLVRVYFRDPGRLYVLGQEIPQSPPSEDSDSDSPSPPAQVQAGDDIDLGGNGASASAPVFEDSMRSLFHSAGLTEWPIPLPNQQPFDEDLARLWGIQDGESEKNDSIFSYENFDFGSIMP